MAILPCFLPVCYGSLAWFSLGVFLQLSVVILLSLYLVIQRSPLMITLIIGIVGIVVDFLLTKGYSFIFFAQNIDFFVSIKYAMLINECIILFKYFIHNSLKWNSVWILLPVPYSISQLFEHFQILWFGSRHWYVGKHKSSIGGGFTLDSKWIQPLPTRGFTLGSHWILNELNHYPHHLAKNRNEEQHWLSIAIIYNKTGMV